MPIDESRYVTVCEAILELLGEDAQLASVVRSFRFGLPVRYTELPTVRVIWRGGPVVRETSEQETYEHDYHVVAVDRGADEEETEKSIMRLAARIGAVIKADPTLGGNVGLALVTDEIAERDVEGDQTLVGSRTTIRTWKEG